MKPMNYMNGRLPEENDPFTEKIIGLAIQVHRELGSGFLESIYQRALLIEFQGAGIEFQSGVPLEVSYKGNSVGKFVADVVVEEHLLLELKAVENILGIHESQVVNYLKATELKIGLILNFGARTLQVVRRKYRDRVTAPEEIRLHEVHS